MLDIISAMARDDTQVNFRIPADLRERLRRASEESKRTLTAEIVARLEASFQPIERARTDEVDSIIGKTVEVTMATMEKRGWLPPEPKPAVKSSGKKKG